MPPKEKPAANPLEPALKVTQDAFNEVGRNLERAGTFVMGGMGAPGSPSATKKVDTKKDTKKKETSWGTYQTLLVRKPFTMHMVQSSLIALAGNLTAQMIEKGDVATGPAIEQMVLQLGFISPVVFLWFGYLGKRPMHWIKATLLDQFIFSPLFNICIFVFLAIVFKGGLVFSATVQDAQSCTKRLFSKSCTLTGGAEKYELALALHPRAFPPLMDYDPIWSTQLNAYYLWLPATILREKFVPAHLKGMFVNLVAFAWAIVFAMILNA